MEGRGVGERVGSALSRGNLRQREGSCDLDVVGALGLVGMRERLADAVYRLKYANDAKAYRDASDGVYGLARSLDARFHWRMKRKRLRNMSMRVLDYWLADVCRECSGLGYVAIPGTPKLSDTPCRVCCGTRKRLMPWLRRLPRRPEGKRQWGRKGGARYSRAKRWYEVCHKLDDSMRRHRALLVALEEAERSITDQIARRLSQPEAET